MVIDDYKREIKELIRLFDYRITDEELEPALDYSIKKRYKEYSAEINDTYKNINKRTNLLALADYIMSKEPIVTAYGTMFKKHGTVPNPMAIVVQQFLDKRNEDKNMMFQYPKGSELYERYNLLQILDKIDANG